MAEVTREELAEALREMRAAFYQYEMDADEEAPYSHTRMMERCNALLSRLDAEQNGGGE